MSTSRVVRLRPELERPDAKTVATLRARAALLGIALAYIDDDRGLPLFVACWHNLTRQLRTAAEVEAFLRGIGGPTA